jgi:Rrf2 family protein
MGSASGVALEKIVLNISRKTDYALIALARLAQHAAGSTASAGTNSPMSSRQIAAEYDLPLQQLMSILKQLQRKGLVDSIRGPHGGYCLAIEPDQLSLTRIIESIEGPMKVTVCCEEDDEDACAACRLVPQCPVSSGIRWVNEQVYQLISGYTLADLLKQRDPSSVVELVVTSQKDLSSNIAGDLATA